jgi:hypothetical protein
MANVDLTNITPPRVPLTDARTGLISREWYRFFLNLFQLTGSGQNTTSLTDLQLGPPPTQQEDFTDIIIDIQGLLTQPVAGTPELQAALDAVRQELQTLPPKAVDELQQQINNLRQEVQTQRQPELGSMAPLEQDNVPWLTFNTAPSPVPTAVGSMYWDGGTTMGLQATTNVTIRIGESEFVYVKASSAITKGQLCYHTGAVGGSGVITAAPTPLALTDPNQIVGVAAESIALNDFGLIQISGDLRGFNTTGSSVGETWADGDPLYYNPAYVGSFTKTKPSAPNQKTYIGEVINAGSGGSGSMHIRIVQGSILGGTDSNVQFSAITDKDLIQYDSVLGYWKNVTPASVINSSGGAPVTKTADFSVAAGETWLINNKSGSSCTVTLPTASTNTGRVLHFQNYQAQTLVSASSNVVPLAGGSATTAILEAVAGANATLVSDGTNWIMTQYDSNNALQLE